MDVTKVILYIIPKSQICMATKRFLDGKGIDYDEIDISNDTHGETFVVDQFGQPVVPVVVINDHVLIGFDSEAIEKCIMDSFVRGDYDEKK